MTTTFDLIQLPSIARYRRPNLIWSSSTLVSVETGLVDGNSGDATILFSDGNLRTETSASRYDMIITQNAVFNNASLANNQGGLRTGSATNNTWYACYAVKCTQFPANWVLVADTVLPIVANISTLNTNFGTNSWSYLGMIRYGDNENSPNIILSFVQSGSTTYLLSQSSSPFTAVPGFGFRLAGTGGATSNTWTYSAGTGSSSIPNNIDIVTITCSTQPVTGLVTINDSSAIAYFAAFGASTYSATKVTIPASQGIKITTASSVAMEIMLSSWMDAVLGIGSNPLV